MPLPFLTADRAFDATDDRVLPYDDRERWRRPYRVGPWRVGGAALFLLLASYVLASGVIIALAGTVSEGGFAFGLAALIIISTLRVLRMGVWVSASGVRQVLFFRTRTTPWDRVDVVRTVQQPVRWLGMPRTVQGQALILERRRDRRERAGDTEPPLLTSHSADFLGRPEYFDRAADTVEVWADEYRRG